MYSKTVYVSLSTEDDNVMDVSVFDSLDEARVYTFQKMEVGEPGPFEQMYDDSTGLFMKTKDNKHKVMILSRVIHTEY